MDNCISNIREVIILMPTIGCGGMERVLCELADAWIESGIKVIVILTNHGTYRDAYELNPLIEVIEFPPASAVRPIRVVADTIRLVRIMKKHRDAVLVAFMTGSIMKCGVLSLFVNNRIVISERGDPRRIPGAHNRRINAWAFERASACVFQTEFARSLYSPFVQKKSTIIANPVKRALPEPFKGERRKTIVSVCRLEEQKNIPLLIKAFARFAKEHPDYTLEVYGEGSCRGNLERLVSRLDLHDLVSLPGFVPDVHERIRDATMFVLSSDYEGISNSMLEALAMGLPSVVTDCPVGGAAQTIADGVNGLLVPVGDEESLFLAMKRIVEVPGLEEALSTQAAKMRNELSFEVIANQWVDVFWPDEGGMCV